MSSLYDLYRLYTDTKFNSNSKVVVVYLYIWLSLFYQCLCFLSTKPRPRVCVHKFITSPRFGLPFPGSFNAFVPEPSFCEGNGPVLKSGIAAFLHKKAGSAEIRLFSCHILKTVLVNLYLFPLELPLVRHPYPPPCN